MNTRIRTTAHIVDCQRGYGPKRIKLVRYCLGRHSQARLRRCPSNSFIQCICACSTRQVQNRSPWKRIYAGLKASICICSSSTVTPTACTESILLRQHIIGHRMPPAQSGLQHFVAKNPHWARRQRHRQATPIVLGYDIWRWLQKRDSKIRYPTRCVVQQPKLTASGRRQISPSAARWTSGQRRRRRWRRCTPPRRA